MAGKISIVGVMAMLVASGQGERCNDFRAQLRQKLLVTHEKTGKIKAHIHKDREHYPRECAEIGMEIWNDILEPMMEDIPDRVFGSDGPVGLRRFDRKVVN